MDGEPRAGSSFSGDPLSLSPGAEMKGMCALGQKWAEWPEQRTEAGPQGRVAKYSQMLTALGHSPDILGETERPGQGSVVPRA